MQMILVLQSPTCQLLALILGQMEFYSGSSFLDLYHVGTACFLLVGSVLKVSLNVKCHQSIWNGFLHKVIDLGPFCSSAWEHHFPSTICGQCFLFSSVCFWQILITWTYMCSSFGLQFCSIGLYVCLVSELCWF